jgi:LmbE family N-acetylglucosaminyl deacetylase
MTADSARDSVAARYTLVAFHAHPDDEALFTGGTLARASAEGHRVVLVTATSGERGLTGARTTDLGEVRGRELESAAAALGVERVVMLGFGDSGMGASPPAPGSLCAVPLPEVAARLAAVLEEERADILTVYDARGGYGHRDHVRVHDAGLAAAAAVGTSRVLGATVPRETLMRAVRWLNRVGVRPGGMTAASFTDMYSSQSQITHEIDVRPWLSAKRAALAAHASQASGGADLRTLRLLSRLPGPVARRVLGREWFVELGGVGEPVDARLRAHDLFVGVNGS